MSHTHHKKGYSLVETLVAISILLLSIVGPMTIASRGIQTGFFVSDQATAIFLAQEQIESVVAIRNNTALKHFGSGGGDVWEWTTDTTFAPCFNPNGCAVTWGASGYTVTACGPDGCKVHFEPGTSNRSRYHGGPSGDETIYTRHLKLTGNNREVTVVATVSWNANLFGGQRTVTMRSSLFNIYDFSN